MNLRNVMKQVLIFCLFSSLIFLSGFNKLMSAEVDWIEVAKTTNGVQFIDSNSIKYNNKGFLSVLTKYSEINPDDQTIVSTNSYIMAIDCENRLFSKVPVNTKPDQVKNWDEPLRDKLIKRTIMNSCSY